MDAGDVAGVVIVARGSSDHAAVYGRYLLELATRRPVALAAPSLYTRYGAQTDAAGWLVVGVSQSGKTPEIVDVVAAAARVRRARRSRSPTTRIRRSRPRRRS